MKIVLTKMSRQPYTISEMKGIVDYLVEHSAYDEVKGTKMWIAYANSKLTERPWQSLKETFLKRILPDIHNPYYKLSVDQIRSFTDRRFSKRMRNKLQLKSDDSNANADNSKDNDGASSSNNNEGEKHSGEDTKSAKVSTHDRSSIDTLVLENCANAANDVDDDDDEEGVLTIVENEEVPSKSTKDLITFSEPLTPAQRVVDDFVTDCEDEDLENAQLSGTSKVNTQKSDISKNNTETSSKPAENNSDPSNKSVLQLKDIKVNTGKNEKVASSEKQKNSVNNSEDILNSEDITKRKSNEGTSTSIPLTDSTIPNNQEDLKNKLTDKAKTNKLSTKKGDKSATKRPNGEKDNSEAKKIKIDSSLKAKDKDHVKPVEASKSPVINVPKTTEKLKEKPDDNATTSKSNPCLNNVSLYAERFSNTKYSSESSNNEDTKEPIKTNVNFMGQDVLVLNSNSDSDPPLSKNYVATHVPKKPPRDGILASLFGFTKAPPKATTNSRKRKHSYRKSISRSRTNLDVISSDWTSDSDCEIVSPPRGRKNRHTKKYIKPRSARILSLETEGGLFVLHGKRIYPLIKDGKVVKKYLSYSPDDDSENEKFWKRKYDEEKKKTEELTKLLNTAKEEPVEKRDKSPAIPSPVVAKPVNQKERKESLEVAQLNQHAPDEKTVKIKFTHNSQEVHIEGQWPNLHPVLDQVVQIFNKNQMMSVENGGHAPKNNRAKSRSGASTPIVMMPVDEETRKAVDQIEGEIFKEIESQDNSKDGAISESNNITDRKRKPVRLRKPASPSSTTSTHSPAKKQKISSESDKLSTVTSTLTTPTVSPKKHEISNESGRTSTKSTPVEKLVENQETSSATLKQMESPKKVTSRRSTRSKISLETSEAESTATTKRRSKRTELNKTDEDDEVRYKLPPKNSKANINKNKQKKFLTPHLEPIEGNDDNYITNTKISVSEIHNFLSDELSNESTNSDNVTVRSMVFQNSSLKSDVYKSESYQLLVPFRNRNTLPKVDEDDQLSTDSIPDRQLIISIDVINSSNVSLPLSPEISVVENISINRNLLNSAEGPSINEIQLNDKTERNIDDKYYISQVDVSVPLMEQDCGLQTRDSNNKKQTGNESLKNKMETSKILNAQSISDSLDVRLHNMLIDSAKKMDPKYADKENLMDVDVTNVNDKKAKARKRCSTPRKRKSKYEKITKAIETVLEEYTQSCSFGGRKSCPPIITVTEDKANNNKEISEDKAKKAKDVIKVKITRPKTNKKSTNSELNTSKCSAKTDSGITEESGVFLQGVDESVDVDLIHNHSDTCIHTNECIGDSLELILNSKSVISINTTDCSIRDNNQFFADNDMFCCNAQDGIEFKSKKSDEAETTFHTPVSLTSLNSLMTEDLSDDPPSQDKPSKWYLLSDEETVTNNTPSINTGVGVGARLDQIFPLICSVPNLSTITEMSENSKKPQDSDVDTKNNFNSNSSFV